MALGIILRQAIVNQQLWREERPQGRTPMSITMIVRRPICCALCMLALLAQVAPAQAQYTAKEWPDGPMKQRFADTCGACHDINRVRVGYTPQGWLTVVRMMQNMEAP